MIFSLSFYRYMSACIFCMLHLVFVFFLFSLFALFSFLLSLLFSKKREGVKEAKMVGRWGGTGRR